MAVALTFAVTFLFFLSPTAGAAKRAVRAEGEVGAEHEWRGSKWWSPAVTPWTVFVATSISMAASFAAVAVFAVLVATFVVLLFVAAIVERVGEPTTPAEWHVLAVGSDSRRVDLWRVFRVAFSLLALGLVACGGVGLGSRLLSAWPGRLWWWTGSSMLGEEWMVFDPGDEVPEWVRWRVEIVDVRHLA
jgi:hypothetical protein